MGRSPRHCLLRGGEIPRRGEALQTASRANQKPLPGRHPSPPPQEEVSASSLKGLRLLSAGVRWRSSRPLRKIVLTRAPPRRAARPHPGSSGFGSARPSSGDPCGGVATRPQEQLPCPLPPTAPASLPTPSSRLNCSGPAHLAPGSEPLGEPRLKGRVAAAYLYFPC